MPVCLSSQMEKAYQMRFFLKRTHVFRVSESKTNRLLTGHNDEPMDLG